MMPKRRAGAAKAGEDLVDDQRDAVAPADAFNLRPIFVRRYNDSAHAEDRLADEDSRLALHVRAEHVLDRCGASNTARRRRKPERTAIAVRRRGVHDTRKGAVRTHALFLFGHPGERERKREPAMKPMLQGDDAEPFLMLVAGIFEGAFDGAVGCLGAAVGEKHAFKISACKLSQALRERERDAAMIPAGHLQEPAGL